jgi:uncharacterized protein (TIGR02246 family)
MPSWTHQFLNTNRKDRSTTATVPVICAVWVVTAAVWSTTSLSPSTMAQGTPRTSNSNEARVAGIVDGLEKAWNDHDMRALANLFHEDGTWVLWTGAVWKGRTKIEEGHAEVHKTVFRNSTQRKRIEELVFLGSDSAVVRTYETLTGDERSPDKVVRSRKILVVTLRGGEWKIAWGQNTRLADTTPD